MLVKPHPDRRHHEPNTGEDPTHQPRPWRGADHIDEEAIRHAIGLVARLMLSRVVENEEFFLLPVVRSITDADVRVPAVDVVDVIEHSQRHPQLAEVFPVEDFLLKIETPIVRMYLNSW
jgi:hypothetical protein